MSKLEHIIGQTQYLEYIEEMSSNHKAINLDDILYKNESLKEESFFCVEPKNKPWDKGLLAKRIQKAAKNILMIKFLLMLNILLKILTDLLEHLHLDTLHKNMEN